MRDKTFKTASNQKYDGYLRRLALIVYKFFDKKFTLFAGKSIKCSGV